MILVVSRLIDGCTTFNDIRRGVPQISPSLLSKRLKELTDAGVVSRTASENGRNGKYLLTEAGRELEPIVDSLAIWGQHWARDMDYEDFDPAFLVWSMHLRADTSVLPPGQTVVEFSFDNSPTNCKRFWLICRDDEVEMCLKDPGVDADVAIHADLRVFIEAWRGFRNLRAEIERGTIKLSGPHHLMTAIPEFLLGSSLAPYERRRPGREMKVFKRVTD
jgi:DNA-binding HxlR family transcriptional regulator